jgi:hypothetical protein
MNRCLLLHLTENKFRSFFEMTSTLRHGSLFHNIYHRINTKRHYLKGESKESPVPTSPNRWQCIQSFTYVIIAHIEEKKDYFKAFCRKKNCT